MRNVVFSVLFWAAAGSCIGADGYITGRVTNPAGQPVEASYVYATDYAAGSYYDYDYCDSEGYYTIGPVPEGSYRLTVYVWDTTDYVHRQYYDHVIRYDEATPVAVFSGQTTLGIDFELQPAASIEGYVYDPLGNPLSGVNVDMYCEYFDFGRSGTTDSNGYYKITGLPAGGVYVHSCRPFVYPDYQIAAVPVSIQSPVLYSGYDFHLVGGAFTVSGIVYDQATSLPLEDFYVGAHIEDIDAWGGSSRTDAGGHYILTNLPPCEELSLWVDTWGTAYAQIGTQIEVSGDVADMDFALIPGTRVSLQVVDAATGAPVPSVRVECGNDYYGSWRSDVTNARGWAAMENVAGGLCEITAQPLVSSGYCWSYAWPESLVYLPGGEDFAGHIAVERGALVTGRFIDAFSNPANSFEYEWQGERSSGWDYAAQDGTFSIRLPLGLSRIGCDEDETFWYPVDVTVTDVDTAIDVGDITVYDLSNCAFISGSVSVPSGWPVQGQLEVICFDPGTFINAETLSLISPISETPVAQDGSFSLPVIPGGTFDVHLILIDGIDGTGVETILIQDSALSAAAGASGISLTYAPETSEVTGTVHNTFGLPVTNSYVVLTHSASGQMAGFCGTDETGDFRLYDLPAGSFDLTVSHAAYADTSVPVTLSGSAVDVGTITVSHHTARYGNDLNGDGRINTLDLVLLGEYWLSDYGMEDLGNLSASWLLKCFWFTE